MSTSFPPFLFFRRGLKVAWVDAGDGYIWFEKEPTAAQKKKIEKLCPKPLNEEFIWIGPLLCYGSFEYGYYLGVKNTYGKKVSWGAMLENYAKAIEDWALAVHKIVPISFLSGPEKVYAQDEWERFSLDQLQRVSEIVQTYLQKHLKKCLAGHDDSAYLLGLFLQFLVAETKMMKDEPEVVLAIKEKLLALKREIKKSPVVLEQFYKKHQKIIAEKSGDKFDREEAYNQCMWAAFELNDSVKIEESVQPVLKILQKQPSYFGFWKSYIYLNLARYYARKQDHGKVIDYLKKGIRIKAKDAKAFNEIAHGDADYKWIEKDPEFQKLFPVK